MADDLSAAARGALPAMPTRIHDQFCRCRTCKPPFGHEVQARRVRTAALLFIAVVIILLAGWAA